MKQTERKPISIRWKLPVVILLVQIPFCLFFYIASNRTISQVNEHLAGEQFATLEIYRDSLRTQLNEANAYLYTECWGSEELKAITDAPSFEEENAIIEPFLKSAMDFTYNNKNINVITFYVPEKETGWVIRDGEVYRETRYLDLIRKLTMESDAINVGWTLETTGRNAVLTRVCEYGGVYVMTTMNLDEIASDARINSNLSASIVIKKDNRFVTTAAWSKNINAKWVAEQLDKNNWAIIHNPINYKDYIVVRTGFAGMDMYMGANYIYNWSWLKILSYGLISVFIATLLGALYYLNRAFFRPLNDLVNTMEEITRGDEPSLDFSNNSKEFASVSNNFKRMLVALNEQKIATYENELKAQRMETSALRLQIRRHFFLNCLKNIYSLANLKDLESIKKIVLLLSVNMRYTLDFYKDAVEVETELEKCHNYVELQGIGQENPPVIETKIEPGLEKFLVPPVSILTILENCCKYGYRHNVALKIKVSVQKQVMDDESFVCIVIQDNGVGFKPDDLHKLNNNIAVMQAEGHVGLPNTMARFRMLHGENCEVLFSNRQGARVELIIPLKKEGGKEL